MKTVFRLAVAVLLCTVLCLCITPVACADEAGGPVIGNSGIGSESSGDFVIPKSVTAIGAEAFSGCTWMESVTIPAGVTSIGYGAFSDCTRLKDVIFEGTQAQWSKVSIAAGNDVLSSVPVRCADSAAIVASGSWGSLTWTLDENGLLVISGSGPMEYNSTYVAWVTSIRSVIIRPGVTSIGDFEFSGYSSLTSVTIPDSVTSIGNRAFEDCSSLTSVTIPNSVTSIGHYAFYRCSSLTSVTIGNSVTSIGDGAFYECSSLTSVTIGNSVTSIGDGAFYECSSLTSVTIPNSVTSIGNWAFFGCISLTSVTIPDSVTSIGHGAFSCCSGLTSVTIPNSVTSIGNWAFFGCISLTSVTIPNSVTSIGERTFYGCSSLTSVTIPDNVTSIGDFAFYGCSRLTSVTIPNSVTSIGERTFYGCSRLTSVTIPNSVTSIGNWAFEDCSGLTSVTIPNSVTSIGDGAFYECSSLTSVTIPDSVTSIGDRAFYECSKINAVYYAGNASQWDKISIGYYNTNLTSAKRYYNSNGMDGDYSKTISGILRSGDGWQIKWEVLYNTQTKEKADAFLKIYIDGSNRSDGSLFLYSMLDNSFQMPWLTAEYGFQKTDFDKIYIQGGVDNHFEIISNQFSGYSNVETVQLTRVRLLQSEAFSDCANLNTFIYDGCLTFIGDGAFKNDSKLNNLRNHSNINNYKTIGAEAFMNTGLTGFDFSDSLTKIGSRAFYSAKLGTVTLGRNIEQIGAEAFAGNPELTIYCYRDSEAHRYAENEGISHELLDNYEDRLCFNGDIYKESGILTEIDFGWSYDLFGNPSTVPCEELAIASLVLSADIYDINLLDSALSYFGFGKAVPGNLDYYNDMNRVGYVIASTVQNIGGRDTNIIAVICRGSANSTDWKSNILQQAQGFRYAAENVKDGLNDYIVNQNINTALPTKLLITGHSRGGAVANILGTIVSDITNNNNVYVYTFACPNTTTESNRFSYDNICNIVVDGDPVPWLPPMVDGDSKFGRTATVKASVNDPAFIRVFQSITGGVSTAAIDNNTDCVTSYPGVIRHHAPAVYMACILEANGTATGNFGLSTIINQGTTYKIDTHSRYGGGGGW